MQNVKLPSQFQTAPAGVLNFPGALQQMNTRWRLILGALGALLLIALVWWLMSGPAATPAKPAPPVIVGKTGTKTVTVQVATIGTVLANTSVQVTSQVTGQLLSTGFKEGQVVQQGDLLFQLDPKPFQAALDQAKAAVARDQATLVSDRRDAARFDALAKQGAASGQQRDQATAAANAMAATVLADKAAVDAAQLNLDFTTIRSPVTGKTGPILIQPGNLVTANATNPLVVVNQVHPVKVSFALPQTDLPQIQQRMAAGDLTADVQAHNAAAQTHERAKVDFVGNAVSATTGTIELRATFSNTDDKLVPGQVVDVSVALGQYRDSIVVPHDAVNVGPNGRYVYALENGNAVLVPVNVLYDDGKTAAVQGKLKSGQQVVTDGQLRVIPGKPVTIAGKKGAHGKNAAAGK
ncbi:MAG TPA: efflux RND transporter periplasmic adaptor subunit [Rhizomicrobium sp.]|jgi:multidrug efflux system membrane fusion protein|nr:efflux RND transporter periplasmic adaptor subunit [Rhizomicrobium sp.]